MKRPKTENLSFVTHHEIKARLDRLADQQDTTRSMVIQQAVNVGLSVLEKAS